MSPKTAPKPTTHKVTVPADAGDEITFRRGGLDPVTYKVEGGTVSVEDADLQHFLAHVEGSTIDGGTPASDKE
jgi:hypothetical protein